MIGESEIGTLGERRGEWCGGVLWVALSDSAPGTVRTCQSLQVSVKCRTRVMPEVLLDLLASPLGKRRADKGQDGYHDGGPPYIQRWLPRVVSHRGPG